MNEQDACGNTVLLKAAGRLQADETVSTLLMADADPNITNKDGQTALMAAAEHADTTDVLQTLLMRGADIDAVDHKGRTALMLAAKNQQSDNVLTLLHAGAKTNQKAMDVIAALLNTQYAPDTTYENNEKACLDLLGQSVKHTVACQKVSVPGLSVGRER